MANEVQKSQKMDFVYNLEKETRLVEDESGQVHRVVDTYALGSNKEIIVLNPLEDHHTMLERRPVERKLISTVTIPASKEGDVKTFEKQSRAAREKLHAAKFGYMTKSGNISKTKATKKEVVAKSKS